VAENDPARTDAVEEPDPMQDQVDSAPVEDPVTDAPATAGEAGPDPVVEQIGPIDESSLRTELEEARDRALRYQAELENYRKRVARQMEEERRYANLPLIRDLLHVWDNMGRAIEAGKQAKQSDTLLEGFKMVAQQLEDLLERHHCTKIEALGKPFDPHLHEAISQQPSEEHPPGTVAYVAQTGFQLHDRVVRPSQVIVSAAPPEETAEPEELEEGESEGEPR